MNKKILDGSNRQKKSLLNKIKHQMNPEVMIYSQMKADYLIFSPSKHNFRRIVYIW